MGREFPASSLERGDEEGRTWDEMVDWERPPFSTYDGEYDYADEEDYGGDEHDDATTFQDWISGWGEPLSASGERRLLAGLDERVAELQERIHYRDMAATAGQPINEATAASEKAELAELVEFRHRHPDPDPDTNHQAAPVPALSSSPARERPRPSPVRQVEITISEKLSASEMLHWQELQKGTKQVVIAEKLGISQGAVSKRERALRDRIDAISIATIGRPYPAGRIDRGLWSRQGRRRNKSASRQR